MSKAISAFILASCLALPAASQTIVQGGGAALQNAIDAAAPGDTLLVRAGQYSPTVARRGISILCDPGVSLGANQLLDAGLTVVSVPAGETFVLSGATLVSYSPVPAWAVLDCAGAVLLENVTSELRGVVRNAAQCALRGCSLGRVECADSIVSFVDSRCGPGTNFVFGHLAATDSHVTVSGGEFLGEEAFFVRPGTPGIALVRSALTLTGDATTRIVAGANTTFGAIETDAGSDVIVDPTVTLLPTGGATAIAGAGTVRVRPTPSITATQLVIGQTFTTSTRVEPGALVSLFVTPPAPPVPTPFGSWWLAPGVLRLAAGAADANGALAASVTVPASVMAGQVFCVQAFGITGGGELALSAPLCAAAR